MCALGRCAPLSVWLCFSLFLRARGCGGEEDFAIVLGKMDGAMRDRSAHKVDIR